MTKFLEFIAYYNNSYLNETNIFNIVKTLLNFTGECLMVVSVFLTVINCILMSDVVLRMQALCLMLLKIKLQPSDGRVTCSVHYIAVK